MINFENQDVFVPLLIDIQKEMECSFVVILPEIRFSMEIETVPNWDDPVAHIRDMMIAMHPDVGIIVILEK